MMFDFKVWIGRLYEKANVISAELRKLSRIERTLSKFSNFIISRILALAPDGKNKHIFLVRKILVTILPNKTIKKILYIEFYTDNFNRDVTKNSVSEWGFFCNEIMKYRNI